MTPRTLQGAWMRRIALGISLLGATAILAGCDPRQALFFLQPFDPKIPPPCPSLKGKRVVVLAIAAPGTQNEYISIDREISKDLVKALRANVKRIDVVDPEKVADWARNKPSLSDPTDAAKAFEADVVIYLEIQKFQVSNAKDLDMLHGQASIHIMVSEMKYPKDTRGHEMTDKPKEADVIHDDTRDVEFPVTGGIPVETGTSKASFKNKFLKIVCEQVSWHFIEHERGDGIQDTRFKE